MKSKKKCIKVLFLKTTSIQQIPSLTNESILNKGSWYIFLKENKCRLQSLFFKYILLESAYSPFFVLHQIISAYEAKLYFLIIMRVWRSTQLNKLRSASATFFEWLARFILFFKMMMIVSTSFKGILQSLCQKRIEQIFNFRKEEMSNYLNQSKARKINYRKFYSWRLCQLE